MEGLLEFPSLHEVGKGWLALEVDQIFHNTEEFREESRVWVGWVVVRVLGSGFRKISIGPHSHQSLPAEAN
jgi:hypothetical protein